ncbi:hypothetical protein [Priestia megaterium]|uniref:hypothetical protein n=1 Tax=Priestia megaterium TaxID=1404 RepID=UPI00285FD2EB|nr:hypothetical protein [Priestia megaterium]MDR7207593.1 hypothetical protein [Priestia megaterium]
MILNYKTPKKIRTGKNLLPNFNSPEWFSDDSSVGGTMVVDQQNPHKMSLVLSQSAQGRLIQIPVKAGQAYTISFKTMTGLYRLYRGRTKHHDVAITIVQDTVPTTFTFVADASYGGYVTLRLTQGLAGTFTFENLQIEEGYAKTAFEPYEEVNKVAKGVPQYNLVPPFSQWNKSSAFTVNSDSKITASFKAGTINSCDVTIPVVKGKSYTVSGKINEAVSRIRVGRKSDGGYIGVQVGGSITFTATENFILLSIDNNMGSPVYGGVATFEDIVMVEGSVKVPFKPYKEISKKASLVPKKNLVPKLSDSWTRNGSVAELVYSDDYALEINPTGTYRYVAYKNIPVVIGKTYVVSGEIENNTSTSAIRVFKSSDLSSGNIIARNGQSFTVDSSYGGVVSVVLSNGEQLTKTKIKNFQLEEGSVVTPFESYKLATKKPGSSIKKAPYRNYPFLFKRENVEVFEGVQYGINNPRIKNGGLFLEEYTFNLLSGKTFLPNNPTTIVDKGDSYLVTAGSTSNFQGAYLTGITVKAVTTYTLSAKIEELGSAKGKIDFVIEQTGGTTIRKKPVKFGDRYYITFTTGSGVTRISTCFYLGGGVIGDAFTLGKDVQLEERGYPTSPANGVHKADDLQIPVKFDVQGGSIEIEFDYHYSEGATQYLFDTNPEERWLIYKETYNSWIIYTNGVSRGYLSKLPVEGRNTLKLSWTATSFELILNGEKVAGKAHSIDGRQNKIFLGQRYTVGSHLDDVIYSCVIKDHNGNIQFQF